MHIHTHTHTHTHTERTCNVYNIYIYIHIKTCEWSYVINSFSWGLLGIPVGGRGGEGGGGDRSEMRLDLSIGHGEQSTREAYEGAVCGLGASVGLTVVPSRWCEPLHLTVTAVASRSATSRCYPVGHS